MIVAGIDPGLKGAIGLVQDKKAKVFPMPTLKLTKSKKTIDEQALREYFVKYKVKHVYIEKVSARPGQGVTSMFNFGAGWGLIRGICVGLGLSYTLVHPKTWKKVICKDMPSSKDVSIIIAKRIWPNVSLLPTERSKKDSDGMADALCIAEYGRRTLIGND